MPTCSSYFPNSVAGSTHRLNGPALCPQDKGKQNVVNQQSLGVNSSKRFYRKW
nr:MAG TPA: hypothetical protein [Caudoviricetes sp.]